MTFCKEIEEETPKAYKYFIMFWKEMEDKPEIVFEALPFEMQLGVYISFFNENSIDFIECTKVPEACLGKTCLENYYGVLCEECVKITLIFNYNLNI